MHAFLITTSNDFPALKLIKEQLKIGNTTNHPDVLIIRQTPSITIKTIRKLKTWVSKKPFQAQKKAVLIHNAHLLTIPAQNALLKTLEEPPQNTYLYLTTPNPQLLLETIISRCHLLTFKTFKDSPCSQPSRSVPDGLNNSKTDKVDPCHQLLKKVKTATPGERITVVAAYSSNRETAIDFCQNLIHTLRSHPSGSVLDGNPHALKHTAQALKRLKNNVNPRLTLESLFLDL